MKMALFYGVGHWNRRAELAESMKYALIFIASFPVLAAYPFVQRYFVKGVLIGSLKG
jgi:putative aldouronate transport system permease protein